MTSLNQIDNFIVLDSVYGKFIIPRNNRFQGEALVKTARTHIEGELHNLFVIAETLPDDAIIVDGGTNIGFVTVPLAQKLRNTQARIIGFEPQRQLYNALCGTLALNGLTNAYIHNCGLGDKKGQATLPDVDYSISQDFGMVQIKSSEKSSEHPYMKYLNIDVITIDSMNLPRLDLLKLDVEGFECAAIEGARKTIEKHRPWVWAEYILSGPENIKTSFGKIKDYKFFKVDDQNMLCAPAEKFAQVKASELDEI